MLRLLCCAIFAIVFAIPLSAHSFIEENIHSYYIYYPVSIDILNEEIVQQPFVAIAPVSVGPNRHLYLKTDIPAYGLLISNIGVEVDLLPHLSFDMPFYYSGWNHSGETTKFRTATLRPELRFWPKAENQGLFVGAHFGLSWFNVAVGDEFRYQDKDSKTPAIGGGLSLGYRLPISRSNRWHLEMGVGAGVYKVNYDIYHNADSTANGVFIENRSKNWFGLDHASISLSYMFDLKGGKR